MSDSPKLSPGQILFTIIYVLLWPALILLISGDWQWTEGWIFSSWFLITVMVIMIYMYRNDPALLTERYRKPGTGDQMSWDKIFLMFTAVFFVSWIVAIPLDHGRYHWTKECPAILKWIGAFLLAGSSFFLYRAFTDNTFLSPVARIQSERKQALVTTGVYGFVRHPMYLGGILMFFGAPLLLGSIVGLCIGFLLTITIAIRSVGEEKMLMREFPDYSDYKKKVRFRFFPFIW